jgi:hypothetical protein
MEEITGSHRFEHVRTGSPNSNITGTPNLTPLFGPVRYLPPNLKWGPLRIRFGFGIGSEPNAGNISCLGTVVHHRCNQSALTSIRYRHMGLAMRRHRITMLSSAAAATQASLPNLFCSVVLQQTKPRLRWHLRSTRTTASPSLMVFWISFVLLLMSLHHRPLL